MARREIISAGLNRRGLDQAAQLRADSDVTTVVPDPDASPLEWASYVNAARGKAVDAVIEWGLRIRQAHSAYLSTGKRWGRTWEDWCRENLGIGASMAGRLELIAEKLCISNTGILPANTDSLYALARVRRDAPAVFQEKLESGVIAPDMSRDQVRTILAEVTAVPPSSNSGPRTSISLPTELAEQLRSMARTRGQTLADLMTEAIALLRQQ